MLPINALTTSGDHAFMFEGGAGQLDAVLTMPAQVTNDYVAIIGHPHSLQGGTMNNKVVTTVARAFKELGIPSLRFNFRGVGQSQGTYDAGIGESDDMLILRDLWLRQFPHSRFIWAGFSFGAYVAYRACALSSHELLITIAPSVHHYNYQEFSPRPSPWVIFQGEQDELVPLQLVLDFALQVGLTLPVVRFAETTHFFHGRLLLLKSEIMTVVRNQVLLS